MSNLSTKKKGEEDWEVVASHLEGPKATVLKKTTWEVAGSEELEPLTKVKRTEK